MAKLAESIEVYKPSVSSKKFSNNPALATKNLLSLFSGCGGMDLGFEGDFEVHGACLNKAIHPEWFKKNTKKNGWFLLPRTDFRVVFANDILKAARAAWVPYFQERLTTPAIFHDDSIVDLVKRASKEKVFPTNIDIVTGGFPCQDFSVAGKRKGFSSHKSHLGTYLTEQDKPTTENRGRLYMWMKAVIEKTKPKVFIAENVKGLVSLADAKSIIENDFRKIGKDGYLVVSAQVLHAADFGVPQSRQRVIFIGFLKSALTTEAIEKLRSNEIHPDFNPYPLKTHGRDELLAVTGKSKRNPYVSVGTVLEDLPEPEEAKDLAQKTYSKAKYMGRHCQGQAEINLDGLGPTIRAEHHGNIEFRRLSKEHGGKHAEELKRRKKERRLTVRECARIQTFPDDFEFVRDTKDEFRMSGSDGYRVIGNAVPPLLAYHIATRLQKLWPLLFKKD